MGLLHSWKAAQGGAPLRGAKRWLHLLPLAGLCRLSRALSSPQDEDTRLEACKDLSLRITVSSWRGVKR